MAGTFGAILISIALLAVARTGAVAGDDASSKELIALDDAWSNAAVAKNVDAVTSYHAQDAVVFSRSEP